MTGTRQIELESKCITMISKYKRTNELINAVLQSKIDIDNRIHELNILYCAISHIDGVALEYVMERLNELEYMQKYLKSKI